MKNKLLNEITMQFMSGLMQIIKTFIAMTILLAIVCLPLIILSLLPSTILQILHQNDLIAWIAIIISACYYIVLGFALPHA